ncbi:MAG: hypothetical protein L3J03_11210 [Desulfobacterales bacterium]|nr:hypothetical protein [Desulfobacterales bacterium]
MKRLVLILICCLLLGSARATMAASGSDVVYNAFYAAAVYPESFDDYARKNIDPVNITFTTCVEQVKKNLYSWFVNNQDHCDAVAAPHREACRSFDREAVEGILDAMYAVAFRSVSAYEHTLAGGADYSTKGIFDPQGWEAERKAIVSTLRPALSCPE